MEGDALDPELKAYLDEMRRAIVADLRSDMATKADLTEVRQEMATNLDALRAESRSGDQETRRHMDVVGEALQREIHMIAAGRQTLAEHIDRRFEEHDRKWDERAQPLETTARHPVADVVNHERRPPWDGTNPDSGGTDDLGTSGSRLAHQSSA